MSDGCSETCDNVLTALRPLDRTFRCRGL